MAQGALSSTKEFTIALADLETLLKGAGVSRPKRGDTFNLSACAARVFVEFKGDVAGIEELVLADGAVTLLKARKGMRAPQL